MIKVLHVIPSLDRKSGGPAQVIWDYIEGSKTQIEYQICTNREGLNNQDFNQLSEKHQIPIHHFDYLGTHSTKFSFSLFFWFFKNYKQFDVIHIHAGFSLTSEFVGLFCRILGIPFIFRPLGTLSPYSISAGNSLFKNVFLPLEKMLLRNAFIVHCTSPQEEKDVYLIEPNCNSVIIPPPILFSENKKESLKVKNNQEFKLGFLSRIHPKKNIEFIFELLIKLPTVKLIIAGSGDETYLHQLKELILEKSLANQIEFRGFLSGESKRQFFSEIDWMVLPSFHENFSVASAESLGYGIPVLSSTFVDATDFGESNGIIRLELEQEKWIETIHEIQNESAEIYTQRQTEAILYAKMHFSKSVVMDKLITLYQSIKRKTKTLE